MFSDTSPEAARRLATYAGVCLQALGSAARGGGGGAGGSSYALIRDGEISVTGDITFVPGSAGSGGSGGSGGMGGTHGDLVDDDPSSDGSDGHPGANGESR